MRTRISLRNKLLIFAILIAVVPLVVAGRSMIRIAQDELKSSANGELVAVAEQLVSEINDRSERTWLAPLLLIRNALDDERLGVPEKIALLTLGIKDIPEFAALQITVEGAPIPVVVTNSLFSKRLATAGLDPLAVLRLPAEAVQAAASAGEFYVGDATHVRENGRLARHHRPAAPHPLRRGILGLIGAGRSGPHPAFSGNPPVRQNRLRHHCRCAGAPGVRPGSDRSRRCFAGG